MQWANRKCWQMIDRRKCQEFTYHDFPTPVSSNMWSHPDNKINVITHQSFNLSSSNTKCNVDPCCPILFKVTKIYIIPQSELTKKPYNALHRVLLLAPSDNSYCVSNKSMLLWARICCCFSSTEQYRTFGPVKMLPEQLRINTTTALHFPVQGGPSLWLEEGLGPKVRMIRDDASVNSLGGIQ